MIIYPNIIYTKIIYTIINNIIYTNIIYTNILWIWNNMSSFIQAVLTSVRRFYWLLRWVFGCFVVLLFYTDASAVPRERRHTHTHTQTHTRTQQQLARARVDSPAPVRQPSPWQPLLALLVSSRRRHLPITDTPRPPQQLAPPPPPLCCRSVPERERERET